MHFHGLRFLAVATGLMLTVAAQAQGPTPGIDGWVINEGQSSRLYIAAVGPREHTGLGDLFEVLRMGGHEPVDIHGFMQIQSDASMAPIEFRVGHWTNQLANPYWVGSFRLPAVDLRFASHSSGAFTFGGESAKRLLVLMAKVLPVHHETLTFRRYVKGDLTCTESHIETRNEVICELET